MGGRKGRWARFLRSGDGPFRHPKPGGAQDDNPDALPLPVRKGAAYVDGFLCMFMLGMAIADPSMLNILLAAMITAVLAQDVAAVRRTIAGKAEEQAPEE